MGLSRGYNPQNPNPEHLELSSPTAEVWTGLRQEARLYAIASRVAQRFQSFDDPNSRTPEEERAGSGLPNGDPSSCPCAYPSWVSEWVRRPLAALAAFRAGELSRAHKGVYVSPDFGGDAAMARSTRSMLQKHPKWKVVPARRT